MRRRSIEYPVALALGMKRLTALRAGGSRDATLCDAIAVVMDETAFSTVSVRTPAPGVPATQVAVMRPSVAVTPSVGYTQPEWSSVFQRQAASAIGSPAELATVTTIRSVARLPASIGP